MPGRRAARPRTPPAHLEPRAGYVAVGLVRAPHGVRGELKVDSLSDAPERFAAGAGVWLAGERRTVEYARPGKSGLLLKLAGVDSRPAAEALRGTLIEIPEEALEPLAEGEYYRFQLIGIAVVDTDGRALGRIDEVLPTGSNDVYVVRGPAGELLLPATDDVIKEIDLAGKRMVVDLLEGLEPRPPAKRRR